MWEQLRELAGLESAPREGWCVAAALEATDLGLLAERADARRFAAFLRDAAALAARLARSGAGRAAQAEAGVFLACFPGERCRDPAGEGVRWVLEARRSLDGLYGWATLGTARARLAAGLASGRGVYGAPPGPVVTGEAAHVADRLRLAARESGAVLVDDYLAALLAPRLGFETVRVRVGETSLRARRLLLDEEGRPRNVRPAGS